MTESTAGATFPQAVEPEDAEERQPIPDRSRQVPAAAGAGVLAAVAVWLVWLVRQRRRPATPSERLVEAGRTLGSATAAYGERAAHRVGKTAVPAAEQAGERALHGLQAGVESAGALAGRAAEAGATVGSTVVHTGKVVGSGLAEVPDVVVGTVEGVHRFWRRWTFRLVVTISAAVGYVLGARAGRERYDQIVGLAHQVAERPEVRRAADRVRGG